MAVTIHPISNVGFLAPTLLKIGLGKGEEKDRLTVAEEIYDRGHRYLLAMIEDQPVGLVSWRYDGRPDHGIAELHHIGVVPEFRDKALRDAAKRPLGIARALFESLEAEAEQFFQEAPSRGWPEPGRLQRLWLHTGVHPQTPAAQKFYLRMGMLPVGVSPDYWGPGRDEIHFAKFYGRTSDDIAAIQERALRQREVLERVLALGRP